MAVCTFFGHRNCPERIQEKLRKTIEYLIQYQCVDLFYVGNQGKFDTMVQSILRRLSIDYPNIRYAVVPPDLPKSKEDAGNTMLPEGIASVHPRYAVSWRNHWMLGQSDYVVTYVTHSWGSAAQFVKMARNQGKTVISLAEERPKLRQDRA